MKILLFGKNGQLGWELQRSLAPLGELVALDRHSKDLCGDLANLSGIRETVGRVRPAFIINAAAYTDVDKAEGDATLAHVINAQAPGVLAEAAGIIGSWLVHYSTDYVFDGSGSRPWEETDLTGPLNVYGRTKLESEQRIATQCPHHLILRTSWVYAARDGNFPRTILRLATERDRLAVVDDQFGAPTGADLLADVTAHMLRVAMMGPNARVAGTYHVVAAGETSWHGYARFVIDCAVKSGMALQTSVDTVDAIPASTFPTLALRPQNSRLNTSKLCAVFGLRPPPWQHGVARMLAELT